ncbi:MAG: ASKHA domain-containing protein [Anaerolineae bacterium]
MPTLTLCSHGRQTITISLNAKGQQSLLDAIIAAGLGELVDATCGGTGTCSTCRVWVTSEAPEPSLADEDWFDSEELAAGARLACQLYPTQDLTIQLQEPAQIRHSKEDLAGQLRFEAQPAVRKIYLPIPSCSLADQRSDWLRLWETVQSEVEVALAEMPTLSLLRDLPAALRADNFQITTVLHQNEIVAVEPGNTQDRLLVIAVDIGTTTIAVYLLDLVAERQLTVVSRSNPQAAFGADVISRISAVISTPTVLGDMQGLVAEVINDMVVEACQRANVLPVDIYEAVIVGNTCMLQLFTGIDPRYLPGDPYVPAFNEPLLLPATQARLTLNPAARVYILPGIGSYVGADITADILATNFHHLMGTRLLIDIGTNGEIVLARNGQIVTCATAAGPAFEGAHIACGMRAAAGAIEQVSQDGRFELSIIGGEKPRGICGSGLLDAVAALVRVGIVEPSGRFLPPEAWPFDLRSRFMLTKTRRSVAFLLAETGDKPIFISQHDIRQLQMAKGAIQAGINILLSEYNLSPDDLDEVLLAGAFGSYISPYSALAIGLLPTVPVECIRAVGNSAGEGAKLAAFSVSARAEAREIGRKSHYVELSARRDFQDIFVKALSFPTIN